MARKSSNVEALYELCQNMFMPSGLPFFCSNQQALFCSGYFSRTMSPADVGLKEESLDDDRGHGYFLDLTN
ncbi:unnamed protein product [Prunus armeniaca]|uniref:Uncharacterized protein n=1 Tax=Prunus armeniaca TaxID=36596 RepID=A0A6J5YBA5_PRUAR|nr:unnamed protein product [Prunus armeniaca]